MRVSIGDLGVEDGGSATEDAAPVTPEPSLDAGPSPDSASPADAGTEPDADAGRKDSGQTKYDPCAGKACGETCRLCDPAVLGCIEPAVINECSSAGACTPDVATCL
jgi:hypothetical protein